MSNSSPQMDQQPISISKVMTQARNSWLSVNQITCLLTGYKRFGFKTGSRPPASMPVAGSLFLYDSDLLPEWNQDGVTWMVTKQGLLTPQNLFYQCCESMTHLRRVYSLESQFNIKLVHYLPMPPKDLEEKRKKATMLVAQAQAQAGMPSGGVNLFTGNIPAAQGAQGSSATNINPLLQNYQQQLSNQQQRPNTQSPTLPMGPGGFMQAGLTPNANNMQMPPNLSGFNLEHLNFFKNAAALPGMQMPPAQLQTEEQKKALQMKTKQRISDSESEQGVKRERPVESSSTFWHPKPVSSGPPSVSSAQSAPATLGLTRSPGGGPRVDVDAVSVTSDGSETSDNVSSSSSAYNVTSPVGSQGNTNLSWSTAEKARLRKAEVARQCRLRKKEYIKGLEEETAVQAKLIEKLQEKLHKYETGHAYIKEAVGASCQAINLAVNRRADSSELRTLVKELHSNLTSLGDAMNVATEMVSSAVTPGPLIKFLMWLLTQEPEFYGQQGLWTTLVHGQLKLKWEQVQQLMLLRSLVLSSKSELSDCQKKLAALKGDLQRHAQRRCMFLESVFSTLTHDQIGALISWLNSNPACMQIVDAVWAQNAPLTTTTSTTTQHSITHTSLHTTQHSSSSPSSSTTSSTSTSSLPSSIPRPDASTEITPRANPGPMSVSSSAASTSTTISKHFSHAGDDSNMSVSNTSPRSGSSSSAHASAMPDYLMDERISHPMMIDMSEGLGVLNPLSQLSDFPNYSSQTSDSLGANKDSDAR